MVLRDSRFFVPEPIGEATSLVLDGPEAHHLLHVLRGNVGDCVTLFDDSDHEYQATIIGLEKKRVQLQIESRTFRSVESYRSVIVASAVPKGDRQQLLIEKLVELGVARWIPVDWRRSAVHPDPKSIDKWERYVVEASKQCGRNRLMKVGPCVSGVKLLQDASELSGQSEATGLVKWILHPYGASGRETLIPANTTSVIVAIGPEGGFEDSEVESAETLGWNRVAWGSRVMRLETAAIAVAATLTSPYLEPPHDTPTR